MMLAFMLAIVVSNMLLNVWESAGISGVVKGILTVLVILTAVKFGSLRTRTREILDSRQQLTRQLLMVEEEIVQVGADVRAMTEATSEGVKAMRDALEATLQAVLNMEATRPPVDFVSDEKFETLPESVKAKLRGGDTTLGEFAKSEPDPKRFQFSEEEYASLAREPVKPPTQGVADVTLGDQSGFGQPAVDYRSTLAMEEAARHRRVAELRQDLATEKHEGRRRGLLDELTHLSLRVDAGNWPSHAPDEKGASALFASGQGKQVNVLASEETVECETCGGRGEGVEPYVGGGGRHQERTVPCPDCDGQGFTLVTKAGDE